MKLALNLFAALFLASAPVIIADDATAKHECGCTKECKEKCKAGKAKDCKCEHCDCSKNKECEHCHDGHKGEGHGHDHDHGPEHGKPVKKK